MTSIKLFGHQHLYHKLKELFESNKLPQSLIINGPSGIGKTTLLQKLIQEAFPQQGQLTLATWSSLDSTPIKIAQIRDLQAQIALTTTQDHFFVLIKEISRLTIPAANALLKSLEEPPPKVHFLLTTSKQQQILPTIRSRCQIYQANSIGDIDFENFIKEHQLDPSQAKLFKGFPGLIQKSVTNSNFSQLLSIAQRLINELSSIARHQVNFWELQKELSDLERQHFFEVCQIAIQILQTRKTDASQKWYSLAKKIQIGLDLGQGNIQQKIIADQIFSQK